jgi:hypothetical protein
VRRILDPFDTMRANRLLAPHDSKLNDIRWLIGESLRRTHHRARLDLLRAVAPDRMATSGFGPRLGLPELEAALHARDKLRKAQEKAGPAAWAIVNRIVIEGGSVRDCRGLGCARRSFGSHARANVTAAPRILSKSKIYRRRSCDVEAHRRIVRVVFPKGDGCDVSQPGADIFRAPRLGGRRQGRL